MAGVVNACTEILSRKVSNKCNFTRRGYFCYKYVDKNLSTDYANIEPQERQKEIGKGAYAINSGWIGMEQLLRQSIDIIVSLFGLASYGIAVIFLDYRILLIMIIMFLLDFLCRSHAIKFQDSLIEENNMTYRTKSYLDRSGLDIRAGKDVRIYEMKDCFHEVYEKIIKAATSYAVRTELRWYLPSVADHICIFARDLLAYFILINKAVSGEITIATFTLYLGIIAGFSQWMYNVSHAINVIRKSSHEFGYYLALLHP